MKTFHDFLVEQQIEEDDPPINQTGDSIATTPKTMGWTRKRFGCYDQYDLDEENYDKMRNGRSKYSRWTNYVTDEGLRDAMKKSMRKNGQMFISNNKTGAMVAIHEHTIMEAAPKSKDAEKWIKSNKKTFIQQYGKVVGLSILFATAWKLFGKKNKKEENT